MARGEVFELDCEFIRESENAILVRDERDDEQHWIPFSQVVEIQRQAQNRNFGKLIMTRWIAEQKGLL